jgi:hypothetical protein
MTNLDHSNLSSAIIDFTEQEAAHSGASALDECSAIRRPENVAARPPAPIKFTRRHAGTPCESMPLPLAARSDLSCIQAMRRQICVQIYDSELCPVINTPEQEDLWASLDGMFLQ